MKPAKPHDWLKPLSLGVGCLSAAALFALGRAGPDFDHYLDWSQAFARANIYELRGSIFTPNNVPLTQWSHGTGLILALPQILAGESIGPGLSGLVTGWVAGVVFWWAMYRLLFRAAGGSVPLTIFGMGAAFLGTHAGFYTHTHGSESIGYALAAVLALALVHSDQWRIGEALIGGAASALLFIVRPNLAVFALPALVLLGARAIAARRIAGPWKVALALAWLAGTSSIGILQVGLVNHWMTDSFLRSPYVFGANGFHSIELAKPQLLAVLAHPWHGLLAYHPLYAIGMAALIALVLQPGPRLARVGWLTIGVLVMVQLYIQAVWYVWWLGTGTFGQRGMSYSAVLLVPALVTMIGRSPSSRGLGKNPWILLTVVGCLWSYLLILQGETSFYSYVQLMEAQVRQFGLLARAATLLPLLGGLLLPSGILVWILRRHRPRPPQRLTDWAAGLLGILSLSYLELRLASGSLERVALFSLAALSLVAVAFFTNWAISRWIAGRSSEPRRQDWGYTAVGVGLITAFLATAAIFARLAVRTEGRIARGEPAPRAMECTSRVLWDEVRESFYEYQGVAGFEPQKNALESYLVQRGGVECPGLALP